MKKKDFSIKNALSTGWDNLESNFGTFAGAMAIIAGISILSFLLNIGSSLVRSFNSNWPLEFNIILTIISFLILFTLNIISMLLYYGVKKVAIKITRGNQTKISGIFLDYGIILKLLLFHFLLIVGGGILFLVVGGFIGLLATILGVAFESYILVGSLFLVVAILIIYLVLRFFFITYFIVDSNLKLKESVKYSLTITDGVVGKLFLLNLILMIVNILGFILGLVLGSIFVTKPFSIAVRSSVYCKLVKRSGIPDKINLPKKLSSFEKVANENYEKDNK